MKLDKDNTPRHIAIIMDGNGRWAKKKHLAPAFGHAAGAKIVDKITDACADIGVQALTLYSFSTENWKRSEAEVGALMKLLYRYLGTKYRKLQKSGIKLNAIGRLNGLPPEVRERLYDIMKKTSANSRMVLTLALNYGGRQEIVDAAKALINNVEKGRIRKEDITEDRFADLLYTRDLPDVDLLIRTSGEVRISNFLLWQISYAEIVISNILWPDFKQEDLYEAIRQYQARRRRFGGR